MVQFSKPLTNEQIVSEVSKENNREEWRVEQAALHTY